MGFPRPGRTPQQQALCARDEIHGVASAVVQHPLILSRGNPSPGVGFVGVVPQVHILKSGQRHIGGAAQPPAGRFPQQLFEAAANFSSGVTGIAAAGTGINRLEIDGRFPLDPQQGRHLRLQRQVFLFDPFHRRVHVAAVEHRPGNLMGGPGKGRLDLPQPRLPGRRPLPQRSGGGMGLGRRRSSSAIASSYISRL